MRKILIITAISLLTMSAQASFSLWPSTGNNEISNKTVSISQINELYIDGPYTVFVDRTNTAQVTIEGESNMLSRTDIKIEGQKLSIEETTWISPNRPLIVKIGAGSLRSVVIKGDAKIVFVGTDAKSFLVKITGSGSVSGNIDDATVVHSANTGSGTVSLTGNAKTLVASSNGSGINDFQLKALDEATIDGSGSVNFYIEDAKAGQVHLVGRSFLMFGGAKTALKMDVVGSSVIQYARKQ